LDPILRKRLYPSDSYSITVHSRTADMSTWINHSKIKRQCSRDGRHIMGQTVSHFGCSYHVI